MPSDSARISPTAHWVGYLKHRGGLRAPELRTRQGRLLHLAMWPMITAVRIFAGLDGEQLLVGRHRGLDLLLRESIESGEVSQVVEIAAGLSPRGREFMARYGERGLTYVEGDLAGICAHKREVAAGLGPLAPGHHLVELDALRDAGPTSLVGVGERLLDPSAGTAVVCEGLTPYLDHEALAGFWRRIAAGLARYPRAQLLTEIYIGAELQGYPLVNAVTGLVGAMVKGRLHFVFEDIAAVEAELARAGFAHGQVSGLGERLVELELERELDPAKLPIYLVRATLG